MPYPFAHPAAVLPLIRPMGRCAVPSALVIGSVVPDFWQLIPLLVREDSHSLVGLFAFCLPVGLAAYTAYHLALKQPLAALAPRDVARRLGELGASLPAAPWWAVLLSLLTGAVTHLGWDLVSHAHAVNGVNVLQHASTALGSTFVVWWCWSELRRAPLRPLRPQLSGKSRACIIAGLAASAALWAWWALAPTPDVPLRQFLRMTGHAWLQGLAAATLGYCFLWRVVKRAVPRAPFPR